MNPLSILQMKNVEKNAVKLGVSYLDLMENAGVECTRRITQKYYLINKNIVILCGNGNNGGDGYVIARKLYERGANVTIVACMGESVTEEAQEMHNRLPDKHIELADIANDLPIILYKIREADYIVDSIFGIGFHGEIDDVPKELIQRANHSKAVRIAIDIPSGIHGDTGEISSIYFKAHCTMVIAAQKRAHIMPQVETICGEQELIDIGIPHEAFDGLNLECTPLEYEDIRTLLPTRNPNAHKGDFGKLLLIAGSVGMGGAAMMSTSAALRCGAGVTTLATPRSVAQSIFPSFMEAMTLPMAETPDGCISDKNFTLLQAKLEHATTLVLGCGLGSNPETISLVRALIKSARCPIVLDADGINALNGHISILQTAKCPMIITPHPGEMARLTGLSIEEVESRREKIAYDFAREFQTTVILKGHETLIALPNGTLYRNTTGNPGMAKGGSGDVLAGMLGAFLAQGIKLDEAVRLAVYLHGLAGDRCAERLSYYGILARDIIDELPALFNELQPVEKAYHPSVEISEEASKPLSAEISSRF